MMNSKMKITSLVFFLLLILSGCTDYAAKMEDDFEEWKTSQLQKERTKSSSSQKNDSVESSLTDVSLIQVKDEVIYVSPGDGFVLDATINQDDLEIDWFSWECNDSTGKTLEKEVVKYDYYANNKSFKVEKNSSYSEKGLNMYCIVSAQETESKSIYRDTTIVRLLDDGNSFIDYRDGQTYKTVTIGTQTWMAENLNYEAEESYCYNDDPANCATYGRLYTWAAAMTACPSGWHLPSTEEFETLFSAVGGSGTAGKMLKSTSGWYNDGNGTDAYAFSVLPAGFRGYNGDYNYEGGHAYFWSSTEYGSNLAYDMVQGYDGDNSSLYDGSKNYGFSVRCLKD